MSSLFRQKAAPISNPQFHNELDIESMISAPLVAASKANVVMLTGQKRFILDYCFKKKDGHYEPVMVDMIITKGIPDPDDPRIIRKVPLAFSMPLICLVPLNSLAVDKVTVDFDMEITSFTQKSSSKKNDTGNDNDDRDKHANANKRIVKDKIQLNGKISNDSRSRDKQNSSRMKSKLTVHINASTLPLPVGVLTILDMYTKAIQPYPIEKKDKSTDIDTNTTTNQIGE